VFLTEMISRQALARAEAERANTAKSQFLAAMSHELRTPLNAIIGYAELIEEEPREAAQDAGKIRIAARQLLSVINVILDLSRLEAGEVTLKPERVAISEILEQVRESAAPLAAANGNAFHLTVRGNLDEAELDHARLYQCVMQLIANASKFTAGGTIELTVSREARDGGEAVVFAVRDTGAGIPPNQIERIFEPFVQADGADARRFEGAGLGLAFVRRVARLMGGDVTCQSQLGRGSTFTLWVPIQRH
jgi:signal transduction histidine kinase